MTEQYPYVTKLDIKFEHMQLIDIPSMMNSSSSSRGNYSLTLKARQ